MRSTGQTLYVAAVYARDGIRLLTAARSRAAIRQRVIEHIELSAEYLLYPADAQRGRGLVRYGKHDAAIELYFARVGERWEREYLRVEVMNAEPPLDALFASRPA